MTEEPAYSSAIARHPSAALYDRVFAVVRPSVGVIATHKRVPLAEDEQDAVLRHALQGKHRKVMRRILNGGDEETFALGASISHSIDVLAEMRCIAIGRGISNEPPLLGDALVRSAEESLRRRVANDKGPTIRIWGDPVEMVAGYVRAALAAEQRPLISLPGTAVIVRSGPLGGATRQPTSAMESADG
jgi:hypothetical protein